jgi:hypothetical protein
MNNFIAIFISVMFGIVVGHFSNVGIGVCMGAGVYASILLFISIVKNLFELIRNAAKHIKG